MHTHLQFVKPFIIVILGSPGVAWVKGMQFLLIEGCLISEWARTMWYLPILSVCVNCEEAYWPGMCDVGQLLPLQQEFIIGHLVGVWGTASLHAVSHADVTGMLIARWALAGSCPVRLLDSVQEPEQGRSCGRPGARCWGGDCYRIQDIGLIW